ncbi:hypothetical protein HPB49_013255 [Dermacentor silvarum]|uniref:Uncharacterized protein n=1 Tax=Dermacentor silvarum TaxID=543639 RepID=A0ACB8C448_DERSI|nr:hypothetical protein HPB49_013255 [Dermacentor silvarum]
MAERASDENTEPDVTSRRPPRRSSILKPARPILESVDSNVTEDIAERRRLSKRVSFSETHQIKLFKCELSGEHGSSCENALEAVSATTAGNKTLPSNAAEDLVGEAVQLLQYDHTPLEQSFYHEADDSDVEAASPTKRASILMEEAQSCLVFAQHGDVSVAYDGAGSQFCPNTILTHRTMDITCVGALAVDQTTTKLSKTMLADKSMEMTFAGTSAHNQTAATLLKTTFVAKSMDMTLASTSALDQTAANLSRNHIFSTEAMDITAGPQDTTQFGGDATVHLQDTVNITCAVDSTSFVTGAANDMDTGAVECDGGGTVHSVLRSAAECGFVFCLMHRAKRQCPYFRRVQNRHPMLHNSRDMMVTCGVADAFCLDSPPGVVGHLPCLGTNPVGATNPGTYEDDSEDLAPRAEAQSRNTCGGKDFDAGKTSQLPSVMDMTCTSSAVPTLNVGSATSAQVLSQQLETLTSVVPNVMNMTCTDRAVSARVASSGTRLSCANPALMTVHYDDANLTGAMNMTCPNTTRCPLLVADTTDLNIEPNGQLNEENALHAVSGRTGRDIDEHSLHQASSPVEVLNVTAPDDVGADGDGNLDCAAEDPHEFVASLNATVGNKSGMDSCRSLASLRVPARSEVGVAASVAECSDAVSQDLPVSSEMSGPSVLKVIPADRPTDKLCRVECATSSTMPLRPTPSKCSTNVSTKGSESKCLNAHALPVIVLTGKDSIAHQHLASPVAKRSLKGVVGPTRIASVVPSSMSKSRKAASKMDLTAATEMFNSLTDSAVDVSNVTALLDGASEYVSSLSLLSDVFSPERVAKEKAGARHVGASGSKSLTKAQQQLGSASRSHLARDRGQHLMNNGEVGSNPDKMVAPYEDVRQDQAAAGLSSSKKSLLVTATSTGISEVNLGSVPKHLDTALEENTTATSTTTVDRCPQPNATTGSPATGLNATSVPGTQRDGASLSACQLNIEPARKSATFLVSSANNARPSATFAVSSPPCRVICIDNGTTVDEDNSDVPLVPEDPRPSANHRLLVKEPASDSGSIRQQLQRPKRYSFEV